MLIWIQHENSKTTLQTIHDQNPKVIQRSKEFKRFQKIKDHHCHAEQAASPNFPSAPERHFRTADISCRRACCGDTTCRIGDWKLTKSSRKTSRDDPKKGKHLEIRSRWLLGIFLQPPTWSFLGRPTKILRV